MIINIKDDFDLKKIEYSGQCFRAKELTDFPGLFRFILDDKILYIKKIEENKYEVDCSEADWTNIWTPFFDLGTNYSKIRKSIVDDPFMHNASDFGAGIRLLAQPHFETLISFIISQRKNIPAIKSSIEKLSELLGQKYTTEYEEIYSFPTPEAILSASFDDINGCGLGYRTGYIIDAAQKVADKDIKLNELEALDDDELINQLKTIKGVGDKVANCVALFSYGRKGLAPVDVWIQRLIDNEYNGTNPFVKYGDIAGVMQQYAFYYMTHGK